MSLSRCLAKPNIKARIAHQYSTAIPIPIAPRTGREQQVKIEQQQQRLGLNRTDGVKIGTGRYTSNGVSIAAQLAPEPTAATTTAAAAPPPPRLALRSEDFTKVVAQATPMSRAHVNVQDVNVLIRTYRECARQSDAAGMYAAWESIGLAGRSRLSSKEDVRAARQAFQAITHVEGNASKPHLELSDPESKGLRRMALDRALKRDEFLHVWLDLLLRSGQHGSVLECIEAYVSATSARPVTRRTNLDWWLAEHLCVGLVAACCETEQATRTEAIQRIFALAKRQPHPRNRSVPTTRLLRKLDDLAQDVPHAKPEQLAAAIEQAKELTRTLDAVWGLQADEAHEAVEAEPEEAEDQELSVASSSPTPLTRNSLARRFGFLASRRNAEQLASLVAKCERAIAQAWLKVDLNNNEALDVWNDTTTSVALTSLLVVGRREEASRIWSLHCSWLPPSAKGRPSSKVWGGLLEGYAHSRAIDSVRSTWAAMQPGELDSHKATTMISFLLKERDVDEAMRIFDEMVRTGNVSVHTYNAALHGFAVRGQVEKANELLQRMLAKGPKPNTASINIILRYYARIGDLTSLAQTLRSMETMKLEPDIYTFTTLLDGLLRAGAPSPAETVLRLMHESGIKPNTVTFTALIKGLLNPTGTNGQESEPRITESIALLAHMETQGPPPSAVTYTAIASAALRNPAAVDLSVLPVPFNRTRPTRTSEEEAMDLSDVPHLALSLTLFERLYARGISRTRPAMHTLLATLVSSSGLVSHVAEQTLFQRAMRLLREMSFDTARKPTERTWAIVVQPFVDRAETGTLQEQNDLRFVLDLYRKWATPEMRNESSAGGGTYSTNSLGRSIAKAYALLREKQAMRAPR